MGLAICRKKSFNNASLSVVIKSDLLSSVRNPLAPPPYLLSLFKSDFLSAVRNPLTMPPYLLSLSKSDLLSAV